MFDNHISTFNPRFRYFCKMKIKYFHDIQQQYNVLSIFMYEIEWLLKKINVNNDIQGYKEE